jgi:hypothetical protein
MNTPFARFVLVALVVLPLSLTCLVPRITQAQSPAKATASSGQGRQKLLNELDSIRLESVAFDNLPLTEVVKYLREQSRKRDPQDKGINIIINPNAVGGLPGALGAPFEPVDVGSIAVRINPPLSDVRLVDVLDAVVKVADRPIKYTVEDYAVVFSLKEPEVKARNDSDFTFPGGTPNDFLNAVQKQYKVDWASVVDLPREMMGVQIPRLRINSGSLTALQSDAKSDNYPLEALISLYNQLGEQKPELGKLIVKGDLLRPSVVMFVPDKSALESQPRIKVKAFSIHGIGTNDWDKLQLDIRRAEDEAMEYGMGTRRPDSVRYLQGRVAIHGDTGLLVATGSEPFVEMVESIVTASLAKERDRNPASPTKQPNPSVR